MTRSLIPAVSWMYLTACATQIGAGRASSPSLAGTYSVTVCRRSCSDDGSEVLARGTLVIEAAPYSIAEVPEPARGYFERTENILLEADADGAPNSCFVFAFSGPGTLAGTTPVGLTRWVQAGLDTISVRLYHSADAGYDVKLEVRSGEVMGTGQSWGPWDESQNSPPNHLIGRRIGPPDRKSCIEAAEERQKQLRRPVIGSNR